MRHLVRLCLVMAAITVPPALSAQIGAPSFEVATIKPVDPSAMNPQDTRVFPGGRVQITGMTLKDLICIAFNMAYWQIDDAKSNAEWITKDQFDVEAKPPADTEKQYDERHGFFSIKDERLRKMLQTLLKERFQLIYNVDSRQDPVYVLERSGKSLRLVPSRFQYSDGYSPIGVVVGKGVQIEGMSTAEIARSLQQYVVQREVIDQTRLTGIYDFKSTAILENSDMGANSKEAILSAVKEMGLQLRPTKGPVEKLIIEHVTIPSSN